jgi:hypothetical protein
MLSGQGCEKSWPIPSLTPRGRGIGTHITLPDVLVFKHHQNSESFKVLEYLVLSNESFESCTS